MVHILLDNEQSGCNNHIVQRIGIPRNMSSIAYAIWRANNFKGSLRIKKINIASCVMIRTSSPIKVYSALWICK